jgi:hypothetical protein
MDKFLIAENPMNDFSGLWIIHLHNPKAIIQCTPGHITTNEPFRHYNIGKGKWTLSAFHFFTTDFISEPQEQVAPILDKAWKWFRSYLIKNFY